MSRAQSGAPDLEAWEKCLKEAVLAAGARVLERLLADVCCGRRGEAVVCSCGSRMQSRGVKEKEVRTILGPLTLRRAMFKCPDCGQTALPGDAALDVVNTSFSPGLRRMMSRAGGNSTFRQAAEDLKIYAGVAVGAKDVERIAESSGAAMEQWAGAERAALLADTRWKHVKKDIPVLYICMDGTGVPVTKTETAGRKGKQPDGSAKTREAKLGCVFTQTKTEDGFAVRDPNSTTFTGAIETCDTFGGRIYAEALRRGLKRAQKAVVLGDGAEWIRNIVELYFHNATQIVDLYHARERVCKIISLLFKDDGKNKKLYRLKWWTFLDEGRIDKFIADAGSKVASNCEIAEEVKKELGYFKNNLTRMRYNEFRGQGLFVGSGVIEAGCKTIVAQRMKHSGMEWSVRGANSIISLRCIHHSNRVEDFWASASG
jgi:hypothetical protein